MNLIWRFYSGSDHRWRWQHVSVSGAVIAESPAAFKDYDECMANAKDEGYVFQAAPERPEQPQTPQSKPKRSYRLRKIVKA